MTGDACQNQVMVITVTKFYQESEKYETGVVGMAEGGVCGLRSCMRCSESNSFVELPILSHRKLSIESESAVD